MNTYVKYCSNVFLAKCPERHEKGETIDVTTRYGKDNESIVFNLIKEKDGFFYYSIVRADGFNVQEWAKRKAERHLERAMKAKSKSDQYYEASNEGKEFLSLGEPIKIGHHSEKRHMALIDRNWNRMSKSVEYSKKAEEAEYKSDYWDKKADTINLSMPESIDYYQELLEEAIEEHRGLKEGTIPRLHSYSLTYAKKRVNEAEKNLEIAKKLWGDEN